MVTECEASFALDPVTFTPLLACGLLPTCEAFSKCVLPATRAHQEATLPARISNSLAQGDLSSFHNVCRAALSGHSTFATQELITACQPLVAVITASIDADIQAKRFSNSDYQYACEHALTSSPPTPSSPPPLRAPCTRFFSAWNDDLTATLILQRDAIPPSAHAVNAACFERKRIHTLLSTSAPDDTADPCAQAQHVITAFNTVAPLRHALSSPNAPLSLPNYYDACTRALASLSALDPSPANSAQLAAITSQCAAWHDAMGTTLRLQSALIFRPHHRPLSTSYCPLFQKTTALLYGSVAENDVAILCAELDLAQDTASAIRFIDRALSEQNINKYINCDNLLTALGDLNTAYSAELQRVLSLKCYVDWEHFILSTLLPAVTPSTCDHRIETILTAEQKNPRRRGLDPALDALLDQAQSLPACAPPPQDP